VAERNVFVAVDFARIAGSEARWWYSSCSSGLVFLGGGVVGVLDERALWEREVKDIIGTGEGGQ